MSHANQNNETESDDYHKCSVSDSDSANEIASDTAIEAAPVLQDHPKIEETTESTPDDDKTDTENDAKQSIESANPIDAESDRFSQFRKNSMAIYYGWQIICLLIFIFTAYETLQTVLPKAEKYPIPRQFFSTESFVRDYPHGNLGALQSKVALSDLSFVMFYAPWSADSQHARPVLETVSKLFYREADFMAINCWQPDGECRHQYKKVMSWPVLMAYTRNNIAVPYNGQWTETALARFVYLTMKPIHRIHRPDELLTILQNHDAVLVLFVNMENSYTFQKIFYQTAIKWLEKDPYGDVAFAAVTGQSMAMFGIDREPTLRLYLWNKSIEYGEEYEDEVWKASLIHKWLAQKRVQLTHWLSPPGSRSKEFDVFTQKGPVLLLFTPRNLYDFSNDAYAMLRQIAYEYHNCGDDSWLKQMGRNYIYNQRKINLQNYLRHVKECKQVLDWRAVASNKCAPLERISFVGLGNSTSTYIHNTIRRGRPTVAEYCEKIPDSTSSSSSYSHSDIPTSMIDSTNDLRSSDNILNEWKTIHCKMINLSNKLRSRIFQDAILDKTTNTSTFNFEKITGFACKYNRTLSFLAMDSFNYGLVAEKLGVDLKHAIQNTAAVIIDGQDESSYVLKKPLTTINLIDFVYNFTMKKLTRHLRHDNNAKHSHFFNATNNNHNSVKDSQFDENDNVDRKMESITITILSSENFTNVISDPHRSVAVLFSSSQCAFCTIFSSVLLSIQRILGDADYVKLARIDSDKNDLPWQYTMETVPAFIIFKNKLESRKYSLSLPVTVQNVLGFILSNLNKKNRLKAIASIVKYRHKQKQSIENTIIVLRRETEISIVDSLRAWRQNPRKRNYIFMRIQALRRLYFTLYGQAYKRDLNKLDKLITEVHATWLHDTTRH